MRPFVPAKGRPADLAGMVGLISALQGVVRSDAVEADHESDNFAVGLNGLFHFS